MKKMMMAFAALAAFEAAAITATKEYVDRRDTEIRTNTYTKAETDARIVEISPAPDMTGVVHGDDRSADKSQFEDGIKLRASDSDGGNMRFRIQDPNDNGISWYSQSSGTSLGTPFLRVNVLGIRHPTDMATPYKLSTWDEITRAHSLLDYMPTYTGETGNNYDYPITAGGILRWFWNLSDFPSGAIEKIRNAVITTNDVCNIVTNEVAADWTLEPSGFNVISSTNDEKQILVAYLVDGSITDRPRFSWDGWYLYVPLYQWTGSGWEFIDELFFVSGDGTERRIELTPFAMQSSSYKITATAKTQNAIGLAKRSDITNTVTKAYVEGLGIEAGISAATATNIAESVAEAATEGMITVEQDPNWTAEKDEYAKTGTVAQVSTAVGTLWSYVYGDSVWIAVTNYMRTIGGVSPSFQLWEVRGGATNLVYWSKEEITNVTHDLIHDCKTNLEATVRNAVAEMPDKAWSKYQSATGNEAPDGVTIVSTPTIQLTGGGEWYRYIDVASNSVWFLKSNGLHTFGGDTNGYFRILDDEGNATFEVRKTDSYLVDAVASSVHFDESGNFCVSFQSNIQPVIYTTASLSAPNFLPEGDDPNVTVTWTQSGGTYTATLEQTVKGPSLFAYAKVEVQGETVIRNTVPTDLQGGIIVNGVKYNVGTATINGNTVLTLTPRN